MIPKVLFLGTIRFNSKFQFINQTKKKNIF